MASLMTKGWTPDEPNQACGALEIVRRGAETHLCFGRAITASLQEKGIETADDWSDFLRVVERDGELLAEICSMLNTDVLQVRDIVGEIQELQDRQAKEMKRNSRDASDDEMDDDTTSVRSESRGSADWGSLRAALEASFGSL
ncbi:hypothetical protein COOONC_05826, partial [Cooperia oncophora]